MTSKRDWTAARAKCDEQGCRSCGATFGVEASHIIARSRIAAGPGENPLNILPLCGQFGCGAHRAFDAGLLDILPLLTLEEQGFIAGLVGIAEAFRRATGVREVAA